MMRPVQNVVYMVMASWMLTSAGIRLALIAAHGYRLDPLPFIGISLAWVALIAFALVGRAVFAILIILSGWLCLASCLRFFLQVTAAQALDPIPAVSLALGLVGAAVLFQSATSTSKERGDNADVHGR